VQVRTDTYKAAVLLAKRPAPFAKPMDISHATIKLVVVAYGTDCIEDTNGNITCSVPSGSIGTCQTPHYEKCPNVNACCPSGYTCFQQIDGSEGCSPGPLPPNLPSVAVSSSLIGTLAPTVFEDSTSTAPPFTAVTPPNSSPSNLYSSASSRGGPHITAFPRCLVVVLLALVMALS